MDEIEKFLRGANEAAELFERSRVVLPVGKLPGVKTHEAELERRWKAGDKNVMAYLDNGTPTHFKLQLSQDKEKRLIEGYLAERQDGNVVDSATRLEAEVFVRTIADHASSLPISEAVIPPNQKERKRTIESVAVTFDKLADSLDKLDSAALGWVFAIMEDSAAKVGLSLRPPGSDVVTLTSKPFLAMVEAGEVRQVITNFARQVGPSIRHACETLPKADRDDPRLGAAYFLERQMIEHRLPFKAVETSYAAECLRTMYDLASYDVERVSYWLAKAADTPNSERPWYAIYKTEG